MFSEYGCKRVKLSTATSILFGTIGLLLFAATSSLGAVAVTINNRGLLRASGAGVDVTGSLTCAYSAVGQLTSSFSDQDTMTVSVDETTPTGTAAGSVTTAGPPCNGSTNAWDVIVPDSADVAFVAGGWAGVAVSYRACTFGQNGLVIIECQQGSQNATIKIINPVTATRGHHK
jgi:hypothetical protein